MPHALIVLGLLALTACTKTERERTPTRDASAAVKAPDARPSLEARTAPDAQIASDARTAVDARPRPMVDAAPRADARPAKDPQPALPARGEACGTGDACADGLTCLRYYGIAGPRGPEFTSCETPCKGGKGCPAGTTCSTIADGPGQVCR